MLKGFDFFRKDRKAQTMSLPFGMIFSIFLIVVFIVIAFIAVNYFLGLGECSEVGLFYEEFQEKVDEVWKSQSVQNERFEVELPSGIEKICFANLSAEITNLGEDYEEIEIFEVQDANVFLLPRAEACEMEYKKIEHINISEITFEENPYCVDLSKRDELILNKGFYDKFVEVK